MANVLKMADQAAIIGLWQRGWSQRRIARVTGVDRETVGRYVGLARAGWPPGDPVPGNPKKPRTSSNPAISTPGSGIRDGPGGSDEPDSNPANSSDIRPPCVGIPSRDSLAMSSQEGQIGQCPVALASGTPSIRPLSRMVCRGGEDDTVFRPAPGPR